MSVLADSFQIVFWVVVGTVTVLTFKQARRTVLQPLRTEVFKLQLEQMREILSFFVGREEGKLREDAHVDELYRFNAFKLMDTYGETFFPIKVKKGERLYDDVKHFRAKAELFSLVDEHIRPSSPDGASHHEEERRRRREAWPGDPSGMILIPTGLVEYRDRIRSILEDPLVPSACAELLEEYLYAIEKVISSIGDLLDWAAPQMPDRYPSLDDFEVSTDAWLHARWIRNVEELKPHADAITKFAREYFKSDEFAPNMK